MKLFAVFEQLLQDLRYAFRMMAAQPLFTAMAVLSLALGIGANTAIYSFMDAILLRALPVSKPESLMVLNWHSRGKTSPPVAHSMNGGWSSDPKLGFTSGIFPYPAFELLRAGVNSPAAGNPVFSSLFAFNGAGQLNLLIRGQADLANGQYVSGEYFSGLGIVPAAGRLIDASDDRAGVANVVVLGFQYAQRRFGDVSSALGQSILINNAAFTVAGVTPPEFFGVDPPGPQDIYLPVHASLVVHPLPPDMNPNRMYVESTFYWVQMMGRLRPGVTQSQGENAAGEA
jgi:macrolide transport system ATP-binding/permease protein